MTSPRPSGPASVAAIVLAGGESRRMGGSDKAVLVLGGRTLLDRVLAAARPLCRALVVVGPDRPTTVDGVAFTTEHPAGGGPVPAVAAGMAVMGAAATVLVLAADLPLLATAHLSRLVDTVRDGAVAAAAVDDRGRPHPLVAAFRTAYLSSRLAELGAGPGVAAHRLLPPDVTTVDLGPDATRNVNCPADLEPVRALLAGAAR